MLLLFGRIEVVIQHIDIVVHGAYVAAQRFDLVGQVEQALVGNHPFDPCQPRIEIVQLDLNRILLGRSRRAAAGRQCGQASHAHQRYAPLHG